jgi:hypothetical protein
MRHAILLAAAPIWLLGFFKPGKKNLHQYFVIFLLDPIFNPVLRIRIRYPNRIRKDPKLSAGSGSVSDPESNPRFESKIGIRIRNSLKAGSGSDTGSEIKVSDPQHCFNPSRIPDPTTATNEYVTWI